MKSRLAFASLLLVALVSGCQTTSIRSAWFDTDFAGPPFRKVIVVGNIDTVTDARLFEDAFVARLRAAGVEAVAGHGAIPDVERAPDLVFEAAVVNSGAQGLLLVRLLGVDVRTQVSTTMVPSGMNWGRGPWGSSWAGSPGPGPGPGRTMVPVQQVRQYELATVETKLFDVKTRQLVWAATTSTFNPRSVATETPAFADLIIGQLSDRGVIPAK